MKKWLTRKFEIPLWGLLLGALVLVGIGGAGGGSDTATTEQAGDSQPAPAETITVTETTTETATETVTEVAEPAAEESADEPEEPAAQGNQLTAGDFSFSDVQVSCDGVGDYEARARGTNNGSSADSTAFTMTLFDGSGSVLATLQAATAAWESDATRTVEFITDEDCGPDPASIEIQLEYAF